MLSLSLVTLGLATIGAYAKPTVRPGGGLELSLSTPANKVASASDLRVSATVKNAGDNDLKILKLGTVLDNEHPTRAFIVRKDGKEVPFIGITDLTPADDLSENDWVVIPAGNNVTAEHDVSALYDFSASGPGTFTFDPVSAFQVVRPDDSLKITSDSTHINATNARSVSITITGGTSKRELNPEKRRLDVKCGDSDEYNLIVGSTLEAGRLGLAAVFRAAIGGADEQVYKDYFGFNPRSKVMDYLNRTMDWDGKAENVFYCPSGRWSSPCSKNDVTTTVPSQKNPKTLDLYFCHKFWDLNYLGCDTISDPFKVHGVHALRLLTEALVPDAERYKDGCSNIKALADDKKIVNVDNYVCYAVEAYSWFFSCP